jgi:hypothetical protein
MDFFPSWETQFSMKFCVKHFYWVPLAVGIVAFFLFFPPLYASVAPAQEPALFWAKLIILIGAIYTMLVLGS